MYKLGNSTLILYIHSFSFEIERGELEGEKKYCRFDAILFSSQLIISQPSGELEFQRVAQYLQITEPSWLFFWDGV